LPPNDAIGTTENLFGVGLEADDYCY